MKLSDFGQTMRDYRRRNGLTQEQLADILDVQAKYISFLENSHRYPSPELQIKMEELIMAEELGEELIKEQKVLTQEELKIQIILYHKLCKIRSQEREKALAMVYQVLDIMAKSK